MKKINKSLEVSYNFLMAVFRYNKLYSNGRYKDCDIFPEDMKYVQGYLQTRAYMRHLDSTGKLDNIVNRLKEEYPELLKSNRRKNALLY